MACSEVTGLVHFRGGFVADWQVVACLLSLEARGGRFILEAGDRFRVVPPSVLTDADTVFPRQHRDEARRVIAYNADDHERTQ